MDIKFVTCSGTNETTNIYRLVNLLQKFPFAEIGVQVSAEQCLQKVGRLPWIYALAALLKNQELCINAALHINNGWVADLGQGVLADQLVGLFNMNNVAEKPFFRRIQLNFKVGREKTPDIDRLSELIKNYPHHRFILSYNDSNKELIEKLYDRAVKFDLLFDGSFGKGIAPDSRPAPIWQDVRQGYAGGIGPDNVAVVLDEIYESWQLCPNSAGVCIDAQRRLEDDEGHLDLQKCQDYLQNAACWMIDHQE